MIPPGDNGEEYKTLDARCADCVIQGGEQQPCMPEHDLAREEELTGFPCPRREWPDEDGPMLSRLVNLGAHSESAHLFTKLWEITYRDATVEEERRALALIMLAYQDEVVRGTLWPERD